MSHLLAIKFYRFFFRLQEKVHLLQMHFFFFPFQVWTLFLHPFRRDNQIYNQITIRSIITPNSSAFAMSFVSLALHEPALFCRCSCISNKGHSNFSQWLLVRKPISIQKCSCLGIQVTETTMFAFFHLMCKSPFLKGFFLYFYAELHYKLVCYLSWRGLFR